MDFTILYGIFAALGLAIGGGSLYEKDLVKYSLERAYESKWKGAEFHNEFPISIPQVLPSTQEIATEIGKYIPANDFMIGASTSAHQCGKRCTPEICSYSKFYDEKNKTRSIKERLPLPTDSEYSMDWDGNYETYLDDALKQMPLREVRFSIEWALVQPNGPDEFDKKVLDHYADIFIAHIKRGIRPVVCLHHYTDPNWFFHGKGAFTKIENVTYFVDYCAKVFEHIMKKVAANENALAAYKKLGSREPLWSTFNAPGGYAFRVHRQEVLNENMTGLGLIAEAVKNTCEATVQVSKKLKAKHKALELPEEVKAPKVGFLKNGLQVDAADGFFSKPFSRVFANIADQIRHEAIYQFFTTGEYSARHVYHKNKEAIGAIDFVGLNYYANKKLKLWKTVPATKDENRLTDGSYHSYPEGLYRAIVELHEKLVRPYEKASGKPLPMFVAENGIATKNEAQRKRFYHEHFYVIMIAIQNGFKVFGYLPWTLFSNYEWPSLKNYLQRDYGVFAVVDGGKHLKLKDGSESLQSFAVALKNLRED